MAVSLSTAAILSFDSEVMQAFQDKPKLRDTVRVRTGVVGNSHRFNRLGAGVATRRTPQADVIPMNLQHTNTTATLVDWNAAEYTDVFDEARTNINERAELAKSIAMAIGRREDQIIIDAVDATVTTLTVDTNVGGVGTGLNIDKLRRIRRVFGEVGVAEDEEITFAGSFWGQEQLLGTTQATSSDFNSVRALVSGQITTFVGMSYKWIANRAEGGLARVGALRTNFAYVKSAVGLAVGLAARMEVNYVPVKTSWLANMLFAAGAVEIDPNGVCEVTTTE